MTSDAAWREADAALYFGRVMHARTRPAAHRFTYAVFSMLVDIDRLPALARRTRFFSLNRFNLFSFHVKDHGPRDGKPLRPHIETLLKDAGISIEGGRIRLLCYPRILGYVFNPLSVYYCYRPDGELAAIVYQVHNTFGDAHSYVAPIEPAERHGRVIRQTRDKLMHVSPFVGMTAAYHFALDDPASRMAVHIREHDEQGPFLTATFDGEARAFTGTNLVKAFFRYPLMTLKVIGAIHFEALRLWAKGVPYFARPAAPQQSASAQGPATLAKAVPDETTRYTDREEKAA